MSSSDHTRHGMSHRLASFGGVCVFYRHRWTCTNIVYMLIDHLLHNETQIEEKLLRLVVKQFIFLWNVGVSWGSSWL